MSVDRYKRAWVVGALLSAFVLGGCATSIAEMPISDPRADVPDRPKEAAGYLPVEDLPPPRDDAALAPAEQDKLKDELMAARNRQAAATAAKKPPDGTVK